MKERISYISRKTNPKYKSIEGVFSCIEQRVGHYLKTSHVTLKKSGGGISTLWYNLKHFRRDRNSIYHITGDIHYMALVTGKQSVLTIHDVKSVLNRGFLKQVYLKVFWFWLPALCVKRITVISHFTKGELERIIPFARSKIRVVYNPVNDHFVFTNYKFNHIKPKILLLGTKPNKNLERILRALSDIPCEVMIIGKLKKAQNDLITQLKLQVRSHRNLSLEQVVAAYTACDLLCFASTYEGFGMPIIEAQAVGRPVITSNVGAMKEVAADTALLVDPYDVEAIRAGLIDLIENANLRQALIEKGLKNVQRFNAQRIAQDYIAIYKELSENKKA